MGRFSSNEYESRKFFKKWDIYNKLIKYFNVRNANEFSSKYDFWTNKVNEVLFIKRNKLHLNNFYTYTNSIKKSIKNRLVSFYIFDELVLRIFDKAGINLRYEKSKLSKLDYINSIK